SAHIFVFAAKSRHRILVSDGSSAVCSPDLSPILASPSTLGITSPQAQTLAQILPRSVPTESWAPPAPAVIAPEYLRRPNPNGDRSEERRVGKEGRSR